SSCGAVSITWNAVTGATQYLVFRNTVNSSGSATQIGTAASNSFSDATANPGTNYFYWIKATNGGSASNSSSSNQGSLLAVPSAPTGVQATDGESCTNVVVSWNLVATAAGYQVWRNTVNNSSTATLQASPAVPLYVDSNVTPGTNYFYWIKAT